MKKYLFSLFIITSIISCSKSKKNTAENNSFVPVQITPDVGACPCCGSGYLVNRLDTAKLYHCNSLPATPVITSFPAIVNITFHDTTGPLHCTWHNIVIDEIKQ